MERCEHRDSETQAYQQQILQSIEDEVARRVNLRSRAVLEEVSRLYEIPIERLIKDTVRVEGNFCKGINKAKQRCLKKPQENGYCGFHQKQCPHYKPPEKKEEEEVAAPWD
jgi:hypothetical protein